MLSASARARHRQVHACMAQGDRDGALAVLAYLLAADPGDAQAHFLKGRVELESGHLGLAQAGFARAVELDPAQSEFHAFLAFCQIERGEREPGLLSAETALQLKPDDRTLDLLATIQSRLGRHHEAAVTLVRAVEAGSKNPAIYFNLATSLKYCGELGAARRAAEKAVALDPSFIQARLALSALRPATPGDNQIAALESLLAQTGDPTERLHICHALAAECEGLGDFDRAFSALERGKAGLRACLRHDFNVDRALFDAMHRTFDQKARMCGYSDADPIFVVGMPRSGTTVVDRILSGHPAVGSVGETMHISFLLQQMAGRRSAQLLDPRDAAALLSQDLVQLGRMYMQRLPPCDCPRIIDKFPLNGVLAGFILTALPNARVVCVVRGAMDTIVGNYRQLFEHRSAIYRYSLSLETAAQYYVEFRRLADRWAAQFPRRFYTVCYEQLVTDAERVSRDLFNFCDLEWHAGVTQIEANNAPVTSASAVQVRQPLNTRRVGSWRSYERFVEPALLVLAEAGMER